MISTAHQIFRLSNQEECDRLGMRHVEKWRGAYRVLVGSVGERDHLKTQA